MKRLHFLLTLVMLGSIQADGSPFTLQTAQSYAGMHLELPPLPQGYAAFNPDYSEWHRSQQTTFLSTLGELTGLYKQDWSIASFKKLLNAVTAQREKEGFNEQQNLMIRAPKGSEFLLVGPLFGSFHSLVRLLGEWQRLGYLSEKLKIVRPGIHIVFLGDVINRSPYCMETLSLVLSLMYINPSNVIYLQGRQETSGYWLGYSLQREIQMRAQDPSLYKAVLQFFKTLPSSLYIESETKADDPILITGSVPQEATLDQNCRTKLSSVPLGTLLTCQRTGKGLSIKALIVGEDRRMSYGRHPGLSLAPSQLGALTWALFSAPNRIYQQDFQFYYDAFCVLTIGESFAQSVLTLYHEDVREQTGFHSARVYAPLTGKSLLKPLSDSKNGSLLSVSRKNEIERCTVLSPIERIEKTSSGGKPLFIGCSLDLTKGASAIGKPLKEGISLCVNWVNVHGGIQGRPVQVVFMDDEYSPDKARENVESFMEKYKSTLFLCNLGSPTLQACTDLIRENKIFVFFPATGAPIFRKPDLVGVVHWRGSYKGEGNVLVSYMIKHAHAKKFGILYQNDVFGQGALEGAKEALKKAGIEDTVAVGYERNSTSFKPQIEKLKAAGVSAIGFFSTSIAAAECIRQAGVDFFIGKKLFGLSDLGEESFQIFAQELGLNVVVAQGVPNPKTSDLAIVKQFRDLLYREGYGQENVFALEGFIGARIMIDILRKAAPEVTHAAINKVLSGMKQYPFLGFTFTFNPPMREIANLLWLDTGTPEWVEQRAGV